MALAVASLVTTFNMDWRIAFWIGACIALVGSVARARLRETPEFLTAKEKKIKKKHSFFIEEDSDNRAGSKNFKAYFCTAIGWPLCFYLIFLYFNPILSAVHLYTPQNIIFHNFLLSIVTLASYIFWASLSMKYHPLKIVRVRLYFTAILFILLPFLILSAQTPTHIFIIQCLLSFLALSAIPMEAIVIPFSQIIYQ